MRAHAQLGVALDHGDHDTAQTRITRLRSDPPLVLRPTNPVGPEPLRRWKLRDPATARVSLAAGAAGPVGGDQLRLDVECGAGAALVLRSIAATLVLPGPDGRPSRSETTVRVAAHATLVWLPGPVIAARGCHHHAATNVFLEPGARLIVREELVLGRHHEPPGSIRQRLRVTFGDRPIHDQELHIGFAAPGWDGPAVTGGRRALGSLLVIDPAWGTGDGLPAAATGTDAALLPLGAGPAVLATALAPDTLTLRSRLDDLLAGLDVE